MWKVRTIELHTNNFATFIAFHLYYEVWFCWHIRFVCELFRLEMCQNTNEIWITIFVVIHSHAEHEYILLHKSLNCQEITETGCWYCTVKMKLFLCTPWRHIGGVEVWDGVISFMMWPLYLWEGAPVGWLGHRAELDILEGKQIACLCRKSNCTSLVVQPVT